MKNCKIPKYIESSEGISESEKVRLGGIHNTIMQKIEDSRYFKKSSTYGYVTFLNTGPLAILLQNNINKGMGKTVMRLDKVQVGKRRAMDYRPVVNVLPLANRINPNDIIPTKEQLENREALMENEPYVRRYNTVRNVQTIDLTRSAQSQNVDQKEWDEYYKLVYGDKKTKPQQLSLFNLRSPIGGYDNEIAIKYFKDGDTTDTEILTKISESSHPLASVAKKLLKYATGVKVSLVYEEIVEPGTTAAGLYNPSTNEIKIAALARFRGLGSEPTLIHEIVHGATVHFIRSNPNATSVKNLNALYELAKSKADGKLRDTYAITNLEEFIVGVFSDASLVDFLTNEPSTGKFKNLLDEILDLISKLFNLNKVEKTLFADAYNLSIQLLEDAKSYSDTLSEDYDTAPAYNEVDFSLKAVNALSSPEAEKLFQSLAKNNVTGDAFWSKIQKDLMIPKDQIELMKSLDISSKSEVSNPYNVKDFSFFASFGNPNGFKEAKVIGQGNDRLLQTTQFKNTDFYTALEILPDGKKKLAIHFKHLEQNSNRGGGHAGLVFVFDKEKKIDNNLVENLLPKVEKFRKENFTKEGASYRINTNNPKDIKPVDIRDSKPSTPSREDLITSLLANYSYTVEINTAKEKTYRRDGSLTYQYNLQDKVEVIDKNNDRQVLEVFETLEEALEYISNNTKDTTKYYSNLTVPGGTNYTENEIATPSMTPSIKGHAQFSTSNGIGWFRSDEKKAFSDFELSRLHNEGKFSSMEEENLAAKQTTKTRRILEVQSDLFQKGRSNLILTEFSTIPSNDITIEEFEQASFDKFLDSSSVDTIEHNGLTFKKIKGEYYTNVGGVDFSDASAPFGKIVYDIRKLVKNNNENQFLQLLNKDNNWVNFFVKSIIQDSARKGYEKVLFPRLDTIIQIESQSRFKTYAEAEKQYKTPDWIEKNNKLKERLDETRKELADKKAEIIKIKSNPNYNKTLDYETPIRNLEDSVSKAYERWHGIQPTLLNTARFYEQDITNVLKKQGYNPTVITDEYGNQWNEIEIKPEEHKAAILLSLKSKNPYQTTASKETIDKVKALLEKLNIPIQVSDRLVGEFSVQAIADGFDRIIKLGYGLEGVALTEEAMHMITMMVPSEILEPLMNSITKYNIYYQTLKEYGNHPLYLNADGSVNYDKIKLEAVGKLLAEYYIMSSENLSKDEVNIAKTTWNKIVDWFKGLFHSQTDYFQEFVQQVQEGKFDLGENIARPDILASIEFTINESEEISDDLTRFLDPALIGNRNAMRGNKNLKKVSNLIDLISAVRLENLPSVQNLVDHINLPSKKSFEFNRIRLNEFAESKDLKERVLKALEYLRNSYYTTELLSARSEDIRNLLELDQDEHGDQLDARNRLYLFNELSRINDILESYVEQSKETSIIFNDEDVNGNGIRSVVAETEKIASAALESNKALSRDNIVKVLDKAVETKRENFKKLINKEIVKLTADLNSITNPTAKKKVEEKISRLEDMLDNIPFSGENLVRILESVNASDDFAVVALMAEGGMTHKDPVVQAVSNLLSDTTQDSMKEAAKDVSKLMDLFRTYGKSQNIANSEYDKFTEIVERVEFNQATGELESYDDYRFIGETNQWMFEDDLQRLEWLGYHAGKGVDVTEDLIKMFGITSTIATQEEDIANKAKELKDNFGERRFIDKYYEIRSIIEDTMLSDGVTSVKDARQVVINQIIASDELIESANDPITIELAMNDKKSHVLELARMESEYDLQTGEKKTGDALLIATTIATWKKAKRDVELVPGEKVSVDKYYITNNARIKWEEEKAQVDKDVLDAEAMVAARPSAFNKTNLNNKIAIRDLWYRENVSMEVPKEFYEERADILFGISSILDQYKGNSAEDAANAKIFEDNWNEIFSMTKGLRDDDGTMDGTLAFALSEKIREKEQEITDLKAKIRAAGSQMSNFDRLTLLELFDMLEQIQETQPTEYWEQTLEAVAGNVLSQMDPNSTSAQILEEVSKTPFFQFNTIDVTQQFKRSKGKLPPGVYKIGKKFYRPIYTWREVLPKGAYAKQAAPSLKWKNYQVNEAFNNPKYQTIQGKISLNKDKVAGTKYESKKLDNLSQTDKEFLTKVKEFYHNDQKSKKLSARPGDSLPRVAAVGIHRKTQIVAGAARAILRADNWRFKRQAWYKKFLDLIGITQTELEENYGEGEGDNGLSIKKNVITIANKYLNKDLPIRSQERDIFRLLSMYNIETHRVNKLRELVPSLNSILRMSESTKRSRNLAGKALGKLGNKAFKSPADSNRTKALKYEIEKRVNKRTRNAKTAFSRFLNNITDNAQGGLAMTRLAMPWFLSSTIKNSAVGTYQLWVQKSGLVQYSESSFVKAYLRAVGKSAILTTTRFAKVPPKYVAVLKRLNVTANYDVTDSTGTNRDVLLQVANSLGYISGSFRSMSEAQLELTMFELFRAGNLIDGKDIMELYDYVNGELIPKTIINKSDAEKFENFLESNQLNDDFLKYYRYNGTEFVELSTIPEDVKDLMDDYRANNKVNGEDILKFYQLENNKLVRKPIITPEDERNFTNSVKNMQQFTQGNFTADNAIYAKQFWLGRVVAFMKGFIYNPLMTRIGKKRILSSGQEVEGYYLIMKRLLTTDFKVLMSRKGLTTNERDGLRKFIKDFVLLNSVGYGYYLAQKALKESGDDDEEETLKWYLLMMYRKIYSEAAVFNPVEKVGVPVRTFFDEDENGDTRDKNPIETFAMYAVGRPAMEMAMSAVLPLDVKGMRWDNEDIKTKDPYYTQYKDNWLIYNIQKTLKLKPDMKYPKSSLSAFEHFDKSVYQYKLSEPESKGRGRGRKRGR